MFRIVCTCTAVLLVDCTWTLAPEANSPVPSSAPLAAMKSDRLDISERAPVCPQYPEPFYDSACLYGGRQADSEVRKVRIIVVDGSLHGDAD
jgi:hypothetical protein